MGNAKKTFSSFNSTMAFAFVMIILSSAIVGMVMFLKLMGENTEYSVEENETTTTETVTVEVTTNASDTDEISFIAKLSDIVNTQETTGDYAIPLKYQGVDFYFKCVSYDEIENTCTSGIGLMQINGTIITLYSFATPNDNYLNNNKDYYIIATENNVVLTYNNSTHIYQSDGNELIQLNNIITSYSINENTENEVKDLYPIISDTNLIYYTCDSSDTKAVYKRSISLETKKVLTNEVITNAVC